MGAKQLFFHRIGNVGLIYIQEVKFWTKKFMIILLRPPDDKAPLGNCFSPWASMPNGPNISGFKVWSTMHKSAGIPRITYSV